MCFRIYALKPKNFPYILEYYLVIGRIGYHCWIIWKRNLVNMISLPVLDTKMNGWGLGDAPQNLFSIVFIDVQLMQKDNFAEN
jgi:hypothetical protein